MSEWPVSREMLARDILLVLATDILAHDRPGREFSSVASDAVRLTDALLAELDKKPQP